MPKGPQPQDCIECAAAREGIAELEAELFKCDATMLPDKDAEIEALQRRIAGLEQNSVKQSEYCEFLEAKWAESKERIAELEETERLLTSALDSIAELLEV